MFCLVNANQIWKLSKLLLSCQPDVKETCARLELWRCHVLVKRHEIPNNFDLQTRIKNLIFYSNSFGFSNMVGTQGIQWEITHGSTWSIYVYILSIINSFTIYNSEICLLSDGLTFASLSLYSNCWKLFSNPRLRGKFLEKNKPGCIYTILISVSTTKYEEVI